MISVRKVRARSIARLRDPADERVGMSADICARSPREDQSTRFAPGIFRSARVSAQLNATVSTNPMGAFTLAGRLKSNSQYCSHSAIG
jgi:hypothetical protein